MWLYDTPHVVVIDMSEGLLVGFPTLVDHFLSDSNDPNRLSESSVLLRRHFRVMLSPMLLYVALKPVSPVA